MSCHGSCDLPAGGPARFAQITRITNARHAERGAGQWDGEIRRGTAVNAESDFIHFNAAHFGECFQDLFLNGVIKVEIIFKRQSAHFGKSQHGSMLAGAVIEIGGRCDILFNNLLQLGCIPG